VSHIALTVRRQRDTRLDALALSRFSALVMRRADERAVAASAVSGDSEAATVVGASADIVNTVE
jgi:hypothetical protein